MGAPLGVALTKDFVATVRSAADIVRLVSDYVPLKQAGRRLKGLCPFHQEKTPSFSVDPDQQLFYCFGCQAGGDVFKFVQLYEKTDFPGSVEFLARRFGVKIPEQTDSPEDRLRRRLIEMNDAAAAWFRERLLDPVDGREGRAYLAKRGIDDATAERLDLGWAPDSWDGLSNHLRARRFTEQECLAGGLSVPRKTGTGSYDRFRGRLTFPIRDVSGRTVAFGGRILGAGEPKYLNSPETPAYVKGEHLYGLHLAKEAIRKEGFAILVEGYLDLAALHQAGFGHAVASLGTALTPSQARLLGRYANRVVVSYDGDAAGGSAAARSLDTFLDRGFEVRVAAIPGGMDPDDYLRKEGFEAYDRLVRQAPGYLDFLIAREAAARDVATVAGKVEAVNALLPRLASLPNAIERAAWAGKIAGVLGIEDELVLQELRGALRHGKAAIRHRAEPQAAVSALESRIVALLLRDPACRDQARKGLDPSELDADRVAPIVQIILDLEGAGASVDPPSVMAALDRDDLRDLVARIAFHDEAEPSDNEFAGCLETLRRRRLRREGRDVARRIQDAAPDAVDDLLAAKLRLAREIDALQR
ncbi:MAG TPA: DNA primase [Candidatus Polarisedimenticolaceae bacterium]